MIDCSHLNSIRLIIFELSFLNRSESYVEVIKKLHSIETTNEIHKILLFQKWVKE